jgi:hypothetical protein
MLTTPPSVLPSITSIQTRRWNALASLEVAKERLVAAETDEARLAQVETCVDRVVSSSWRSPCLPLTG